MSKRLGPILIADASPGTEINFLVETDETVLDTNNLFTVEDTPGEGVTEDGVEYFAFYGDSSTLFTIILDEAADTFDFLDPVIISIDNGDIEFDATFEGRNTIIRPGLSSITGFSFDTNAADRQRIRLSGLEGTVTTNNYYFSNVRISLPTSRQSYSLPTGQQLTSTTRAERDNDLITLGHSREVSNEVSGDLSHEVSANRDDILALRNELEVDEASGAFDTTSTKTFITPAIPDIIPDAFFGAPNNTVYEIPISPDGTIETGDVNAFSVSQGNPVQRGTDFTIIHRAEATQFSTEWNISGDFFMEAAGGSTLSEDWELELFFAVIGKNDDGTNNGINTNHVFHVPVPERADHIVTIEKEITSNGNVGTGVAMLSGENVARTVVTDVTDPANPVVLTLNTDYTINPAGTTVEVLQSYYQILYDNSGLTSPAPLDTIINVDFETEINYGTHRLSFSGLIQQDGRVEPTAIATADLTNPGRVDFSLQISDTRTAANNGDGVALRYFDRPRSPQFRPAAYPSGNLSGAFLDVDPRFAAGTVVASHTAVRQVTFTSKFSLFFGTPSSGTEVTVSADGGDVMRTPEIYTTNGEDWYWWTDLVISDTDVISVTSTNAGLWTNGADPDTATIRFNLIG